MTVALVAMTDSALEEAKAAGVDPAVIVGITPNGDFYFASSTESAAEIVFLLQHGIWRLHTQTDKEIGG